MTAGIRTNKQIIFEFGDVVNSNIRFKICSRTSVRNVEFLIFVSTLFNLCYSSDFKSLSEAYKPEDAILKHVPSQQSSVIGLGELHIVCDWLT